MYKLVVLTFLAVAAAEPSTVIVGPTAYSTVIAPGTTTITKQASSVVHPSPPVLYSAPLTFAHFIKKRSVVDQIAFPYAATYYDNNQPLPPYSAPIIHSNPIIHTGLYIPAPQPNAAAHYIKKRSLSFLPTYHAATTYAAAAPILTSSYVTPALHTPVISTYSATPLHTSVIASRPLIHHPVTYTPHFIKKRSTAFLAPYAAVPTSYSHQSRVDISHSAPYVTTYSAPYVYSSHLGYSHIY